MSRKYYIATYSAHGTIIKNLVGSDKLECLCINCGGFRCPQNSIDLFEDDASMFKNSVAISKKTLHAKVVLVCDDTFNELWLWTGNMRQSTLHDRNVLLSIPLDKKADVNSTQKWFVNLAQKKGTSSSNLIFDEKKGVSFPEQDLWISMKQSIDFALKGKAINDLTVYACAPWGSKRFVDELCSLKYLQNAKINLFTRNVPQKNVCWMDGSNVNVSCFVAKNDVFPHYKMIFITQKCKGKEKIIWSYIGSANFTESAMFADKKGSSKNIEHAAFFYGNSNNISLLLEELKSKKLWKTRKRKITIDENKIPKEDDESESYDIDGFMCLDVAKKLSFLFDNKQCQKVLDDCYEEETNFTDERKSLTIWNYKFDTCKFEFFFIGSVDYAYHLRVRLNPKEPWYTLDVPRMLDNSCFNETAYINQMFEFLVSDVDNGKCGKEKRKKKKDDTKMNVVKRLNIRFPIERVMENENLIIQLKRRLSKIASASSSFDEEQKKMYAIWSTLLKEF